MRRSGRMRRRSGRKWASARPTPPWRSSPPGSSARTPPSVVTPPRCCCRWQLPDAQSSVLASTANDLRRDRYPQPINPERLKDAAAGLSQIGKAFAIATAIIFGGVTSIVAFTASKLEIQNTDDIRMKGRDMIQPRAELIREQMAPLRTWAEKFSRKWHSSGENEANGNPIVQQLLKVLGNKDL